MWILSEQVQKSRVEEEIVAPPEEITHSQQVKSVSCPTCSSVLKLGLCLLQISFAHDLERRYDLTDHII